MILEHAVLPVRRGQETEFEAAFAQARGIIESMPGVGRVSLSRGIESPNRYLLLVEWDRVTDHTEGFRGSPEYEQWKSLLHRFYDPFPTAEHFDPVHTDGDGFRGPISG